MIEDFNKFYTNDHTKVSNGWRNAKLKKKQYLTSNDQLYDWTFKDPKEVK